MGVGRQAAWLLGHLAPAELNPSRARSIWRAGARDMVGECAFTPGGGRSRGAWYGRPENSERWGARRRPLIRRAAAVLVESSRRTLQRKARRWRKKGKGKGKAVSPFLSIRSITALGLDLWA